MARRKFIYLKNHMFLPDGQHLCSRVTMAEKLERQLTSDELVHHINGDKLDDRIENLQVLSPKEHRSLHCSQHPRQSRAERLKKMREYSRKRISNETPEERVERLKKQREYDRKRYEDERKRMKLKKTLQ